MHKMELKVSDSMIKNKIKIKFKQDYRSWEFCSFNSSSSDKREPFSKLTYLLTTAKAMRHAHVMQRCLCCTTQNV